MTDVIITPARPLDAGAIGHILSVSNEAMPWLPRLHSAAEEIMYAGDMIEAEWVKVAKREGKVIAFIARHNEQVHALYVLPDAQDQGVGTALLQDAKETCETLRLWSYQANGSAARFYGLRGFIEIERTDGNENDAGLPDILFEWSRGKK